MLLQLDKAMVNSVFVYNPHVLNSQMVTPSGTIMDTILTIAMAVIAIANIILTFHIFRQNRKDSNDFEQQQRSFVMMQKLIIDSNIQRLYAFYDNIMEECKKLLVSDAQETKAEVNTFIKGQLKVFRRDFTTLFSVIDSNLSKELLELADKLVDGITEAIYDQGVNLTYEPKFDEMVSQQLSKNRTEMLAVLYRLALLTNNKCN